MIHDNEYGYVYCKTPEDVDEYAKEGGWEDGRQLAHDTGFEIAELIGIWFLAAGNTVYDASPEEVEFLNKKHSI